MSVVVVKEKESFTEAYILSVTRIMNHIGEI